MTERVFFKINLYIYPMYEELKYWYLRDHKLFWTLSMSQIKQLCIITGFKKANKGDIIYFSSSDDCGDCFRSQFASIPGVAVRAVLPGALAALTSEVGTDFGGQVLGEDVYG